MRRHVRNPVILALALGAGLVAAPPAAAQVVGAEGAMHSLTVGRAELTELVIPIGASVPLGPFRVDVNTSYAQASLTRGDSTETLSGTTDIITRLSVGMLDGRVRLAVAGNLPTGEPLDTAKRAVASAIATQLLTLPVGRFRAGRGVTSVVAVAQPLGDWVVGLSGTYRVGGAYQPFLNVQTSAGNPLEFQPGDEQRATFALERRGRSGWAMRMSGSWSRYGLNRENEEEVFQPGERYLVDAMVEFPLGRGSGTLYAWDMYRLQGEVFDSTGAALQAAQFAPPRNLGSIGARLRLPLGGSVSLRPVGEVIVQNTFSADEGYEGPKDGWLARAGGGIAIRLGGGLVVEPGALWQTGAITSREDDATREDGINGFIVRLGAAWAR